MSDPARASSARTMDRLVCAAACFLCTLLAGAGEVEAKRLEGLTLTAGAASTVPVLSAKQIGFTLDASLPLRSEMFEVGAGIRVMFSSLQPGTAVSGILRGGLVAPFGRWRPAAGIELEVTSAPNPTASDEHAISGSLQTFGDEAGRWDYFRLGGYAAPVRLTFGWFAVSALEVFVGTPLSGHFGQVLDVIITVLKAGWRFR